MFFGLEMEKKMRALPSKCSGYFLLSIKIMIIMNIRVSVFYVSWVSWAGFKFPLVQNWAGIFVYLWFVLAWFHCLQLEAGQGTTQVSMRQSRQRTYLLRDFTDVCVHSMHQAGIREEITGIAAIHPLHLFSLLRSCRHPSPTSFQ